MVGGTFKFGGIVAEIVFLGTVIDFPSQITTWYEMGCSQHWCEANSQLLCGEGNMPEEYHHVRNALVAFLIIGILFDILKAATKGKDNAMVGAATIVFEEFPMAVLAFYMPWKLKEAGLEDSCGYRTIDFVKELQDAAYATGALSIICAIACCARFAKGGSQGGRVVAFGV